MSESEASGSEARLAATARSIHGTIGSLEAFDPKTDTVAAYAERAELYMDANDMPEARRVATFLNCVGKTTYAIIRNLMIPDTTLTSLGTAAPMGMASVPVVETSH